MHCHRRFTDRRKVIKRSIAFFTMRQERLPSQWRRTDKVDQVTLADISDPQELRVRTTALSMDYAASIAPGFEALVFKAARNEPRYFFITLNGSLRSNRTRDASRP
jgi:hypothetical protein